MRAKSPYSVMSDYHATDDIPLGVGGVNLVSNKFREIRGLTKALSNQEGSHPAIPNGKNVYFKVENNIKVDRRNNGQSSVFHDDCGVWNRSAGLLLKQHTLCRKHHLKCCI